jgi:hypothetical protein
VFVIKRDGSAMAPDNASLEARAVFTGAGRPTLLTTETVNWRLVTHRHPATPPVYVTRTPTPVRAS